MSTDQAPSEESVAKKETWADTINFKHLFRVKGKKVLFFPIGEASKDGICPMYEFLGKERCSAKLKDLERLHNFYFHLANGEKIHISQVFDNLHDKYGDNLDLKLTEEMMEVMVPGYDREAFKSYHAEKVLTWYLEIKGKIKLNTDGPKEETKQEDTHRESSTESA